MGVANRRGTVTSGRKVKDLLARQQIRIKGLCLNPFSGCSLATGRGRGRGRGSNMGPAADGRSVVVGSVVLIGLRKSINQIRSDGSHEFLSMDRVYVGPQERMNGMDGV